MHVERDTPRSRDACRDGNHNLLRICWNQWSTERALARRGISFRVSDPSSVHAAYSAMTEREFQAINGRQSWANWRTVPQALSGLIPDEPLLAVDLGCGTGDSTRVLACCVPLRSRIIGYELSESLIDIARRRPYRDSMGENMRIEFVRQSITEPFRDASGESLAGGSVDVVNASGVVGQHLDADAARTLAGELRRVLKSSGIAMLDVGRSLPRRELTAVMRSASFERLRYSRSSIFDRTGQLTFRPNFTTDPRG